MLARHVRLPAPRRLTLAAGMVAGLLAAGALVTPPALASPPPVFTGALLVSTDYDFDSTGTCHLTSTADAANVPYEATGATTTHSFTSTGAVTDSANLADTTSMTARTTGSTAATLAGGSLKTLHLSTSMAATTDPALGAASACDVSAVATAGVHVIFTLAAARWLTVHTSSSSSHGYLSIQSMGSTGAAYIVAVVLGRFDNVAHVLLPAGQYDTVVTTEALAAGPDSSIPSPSTVSTSTDLTFAPVGSATTGTSGTGAALVTLSGARSCVGHSLTAGFSKQASTVASATFFVNGTKSRAVAHPTRHTAVVLAHLADSAAVTVKAVLKLRSGGSRTASRSYTSCS